MEHKRISMIVLFLGAFAFGLLLGGTPGFGQMTPLDGKVFVGEIGKKGQKAGDKDDLIFKDGKFLSTACAKYGFTEAPYTAMAGEKKTTFETETVSPKEGTMKWKGTVQGEMVRATVIWSKPGNKPQELWYRGKLGQQGG